MNCCCPTSDRTGVRAEQLTPGGRRCIWKSIQGGCSQSVESCPELLFTPHVWAARRFQDVPSSGGLPLLLWVARGKKSGNLWADQTFCKQGWRCRSEGLSCKFPVPDLAVQQDHGQQAGAMKGHFSMHQFGVFQGVLSKILLSQWIWSIIPLVLMEMDSRFTVVLERRGKRLCTEWVVGRNSPFFSFLPQFSMRNHIDSSFQPANANWDKLGGRLTNYCNVMVAMLQFRLQKAFNYQLYFSQLPFNW